jgi:hypothetical protein
VYDFLVDGGDVGVVAGHFPAEVGKAGLAGVDVVEGELDDCPAPLEFGRLDLDPVEDCLEVGTGQAVLCDEVRVEGGDGVFFPELAQVAQRRLDGLPVHFAHLQPPPVPALPLLLVLLYRNVVRPFTPLVLPATGVVDVVTIVPPLLAAAQVDHVVALGLVVQLLHFVHGDRN